MGNRADERHDHSGEFALQHEIAAREIDEQGWCGVFAVAGGRLATGARELFDDLLRLPYFVDTDLLWLPLADDRQCAAADAAQRRIDDEKLHQLQLSGAARRRVFPGRGWNGDRASRCAGAFFVRGAGELAEREPRMALLRAADNFGGRIVLTIV